MGRPPVEHSVCPRCGARRTVETAETTPLCPSCLFAVALVATDTQEDAAPAIDDPPPFDIVTILARDADAVTYLARGFVSPDHIALKIIDVPDLAAIVSRVWEWKTRLTNARHPGISRLIDAGAAGHGRAYLATEYVAGSSLDHLLRHGSLTKAERLDIARQVTDALAAMHDQGLPHMRVDSSRIKVATSGGVQATLLGIGTSLIVAGSLPQPELDVRALVELFRALGVPLRPQPYATIAQLRAAVEDVA